VVRAAESKVVMVGSVITMNSSRFSYLILHRSWMEMRKKRDPEIRSAVHLSYPGISFVFLSCQPEIC